MTGSATAGLTVHDDPAALFAVTRALRRTVRPVVLSRRGSAHAATGADRSARATPGAAPWCRSSSTPCSSVRRRTWAATPHRGADLRCAASRRGAVFAPGSTPCTRQDPHHRGSRTAVCERRRQPAGHFAGVLTVVATLFGSSARMRGLRLRTTASRARSADGAGSAAGRFRLGGVPTVRELACPRVHRNTYLPRGAGRGSRALALWGRITGRRAWSERTHGGWRGARRQPAVASTTLCARPLVRSSRCAGAAAVLLPRRTSVDDKRPEIGVVAHH